jgi:hypothetical protein
MHRDRDRDRDMGKDRDMDKVALAMSLLLSETSKSLFIQDLQLLLNSRMITNNQGETADGATETAGTPPRKEADEAVTTAATTTTTMAATAMIPEAHTAVDTIEVKAVTLVAVVVVAMEEVGREARLLLLRIRRTLVMSFTIGLMSSLGI